MGYLLEAKQLEETKEWYTLKLLIRHTYRQLPDEFLYILTVVPQLFPCAAFG